MSDFIKFDFGKYTEKVDQEFNRLIEENVVDRIWKKDHTVWRDDPEEIANRLGWLDSVSASRKELEDINNFVNTIKGEGFTHALLMGMGGSSLAPEVFSLIFGNDNALNLSVLDSTDPGAVLEFKEKLSGKKTLFIVSTKSGGTVETISFMKYFYNEMSKEVGAENAGSYFVAITDPGSGLEKMAKDLNFKKIFLNDPNIGGRYSVLSLFGCVPAALTGVDLELLFNKASDAIDNSKLNSDKNAAAHIGTALGALAKIGLDKLTFIMSDKIKYLGAWIEQLVAESTGKAGKGILPVDLEEFLEPEFYSNDRVFVYFHLKSDDSYKDRVNKIKDAGFPVIEIILENSYDIGREFFNWEFATAVAGWSLDIQPFDQPNVESAKVQARKFMKAYQETGSLPELNPIFHEDGMKFYGDLKSINISGALDEFFGRMKQGKDDVDGRSYVCLQAFIKPEQKVTEAMHELRTVIQKKYKLATSMGYGPRFLHSTGQLHKGDRGNGLYIQFTSDNLEDAQIPDEAGSNDSSVSFGVLIKAQTLGDRQALLDNHRDVFTIDLGKDTAGNIKKLVSKLA